MFVVCRSPTSQFVIRIDIYICKYVNNANLAVYYLFIASNLWKYLYFVYECNMNEFDCLICIFKHQSQITNNDQCKNCSSHQKLYCTFSLGTPFSNKFQCYLSVPYSRHPKHSKNIVKCSYRGGVWRAYLAHGLIQRMPLFHGLSLNNGGWFIHIIWRWW